MQRTSTLWTPWSDIREQNVLLWWVDDLDGMEITDATEVTGADSCFVCMWCHPMWSFRF